MTEKWDKRFVNLAEHVSKWSLDPSTKTGAVIVRPNRTIVSMGYNGFPVNTSDDAALYADREIKYERIVHCTTPNHKTLTADLRWKELGALTVGERLVGFEEQNKLGLGRKYITATVEEIKYAVEPTFRVSFSDGTFVDTTAEHKWLTGVGTRTVRKWTETNRLRTAYKHGKCSTKIGRLFPMFSDAIDYESGWFAGLLDGEGSFMPKRGNVLSFAQRPGLVLERALSYLKRRELDYSVRAVCHNMKGGLGRGDTQCVHIRGNLADRLAFLGSIRPSRLIDKVNPNLFGRVQTYNNEALAVETVEPIGNKEIIKIQTSSRTIVIDGFPMHNCEMNAILTAYEPLHGCTLYTWPFLSCPRCAAHVVQAGITRVVAPKCPEEKLERWSEALERAKLLFMEAGVEVVEL